MKKIYVKPELKAINVNVNTILCVSNIGLSAESQGNSSALGRDFDFEDDED